MFHWPSDVLAAVERGDRVVYRGSLTRMHGAVVARVALCGCPRCVPRYGYARLVVHLVAVISANEIHIWRVGCVRPQSFRVEPDLAPDPSIP